MRLEVAGIHRACDERGRLMAIYTPIQVPSPEVQNRGMRRSPAAPRRVHTRTAHNVGLGIDITLAVIVVVALLFVFF